MKRIFIITLIICLAALPLFTGCGLSDTVEGFVVSEAQLADRSAIENAKQPSELAAGKDLYACVSFIESPKGMKYTINWILDGQSVKTEDKATATEPRSVIVYTIEKAKLHAGALKVQILYQDTVLAEKDVTVK